MGTDYKKGVKKMKEEDIKRIEKKVDLLYKILLELNISDVGHPYDQTYINKFMDELVLLFGLSVKKGKIKPEDPTPEELIEATNDYKNELEQLEKDYEEGDYLAKEKNGITTKISDLKEKIKGLPNILHSREKIVGIYQEIYEIDLFWDLRKKLGLTKVQGYEKLSLSNLNHELKGLLEMWKGNG